jgi:hypothetical protein
MYEDIGTYQQIEALVDGKQTRNVVSKRCGIVRQANERVADEDKHVRMCRTYHL